MINTSLTKKLIIGLVIVNIVLIVAYGFIYSRVSSYEMQAAQAYAKLGVNKKGTDAYNELEKSVKTSAADRALLASYFVGEDGIVSFLEGVESLGKPTGAKVTLDSVHKQTQGSDKYLELAVTAKGSFSQVFHFLSLLEALPYKMSFSKVFFTKNSTGKDEVFGFPSAQGSDEVQKDESGSHTMSIDVSKINGTPSASGNQVAPHRASSGSEWTVSVNFRLLSFEYGI